MTTGEPPEWLDHDPSEPDAEESRPVAGKGRVRLVDPDGRPDVFLTAESHETTAQMISALASDESLYHRAREVVHVIRAEAGDDPSTDRLAPGTPVVRPCPLSFLRDRVSMHARCLGKARSKSGGWVHVAPPKDAVLAVLERGEWPAMRELDAVIESPFMRPDGSVVQDAGYDRATRLLYLPSGRFRRMPERPAHTDAVRAYAALADVFRDFPYVDESHRSAVVAAILTVVGRPAIRSSVPCWLFDAAATRSGKSLQVDLVHIITTGRPASRLTFPETDEELEKVLGSLARAGARLINLDDIGRVFGGAPLQKVLTAVDTVQLRILGVSETPSFPWVAVVFASGNNVRVKDDMLARILSPRLESPLDNPEKRDDFSDPDRAGADAMRRWTLERREDLCIDALTILRAFCVAGRPPQACARWGGFDLWRDLVAQALVWVGAPDPLGARRGEAGDEDDVRAAQALLVAGWERLTSDLPQGISVKDAVGVLYPHHRDEGPPDGHDDLRAALETLTGARQGLTPSTRAVGDALRKVKSRPFAGAKLVTWRDASGSAGKTAVAARWLVRRG